MNQFSSPKEASGTLFSTTKGPRVSSRLSKRRLVAALTFATLVIAVSACSHSGAEIPNQAGLPSDTTVISISAYEGRGTPSFAEVHVSEALENIDGSEEPGTDYLTEKLRNLPWIAR